jgi:hypothetical protein
MMSGEGVGELNAEELVRGIKGQALVMRTTLSRSLERMDGSPKIPRCN